MHLNIIKFTYHSIAQRRGVAALNSVHGNRMAILAGDFLLSRASINLARLCSIEARARARRAQTLDFHKILETHNLYDIMLWRRWWSCSPPSSLTHDTFVFLVFLELS